MTRKATPWLPLLGLLLLLVSPLLADEFPPITLAKTVGEIFPDAVTFSAGQSHFRRLVIGSSVQGMDWKLTPAEAVPLTGSYLIFTFTQSNQLSGTYSTWNSAHGFTSTKQITATVPVNGTELLLIPSACVGITATNPNPFTVTADYTHLFRTNN